MQQALKHLADGFARLLHERLIWFVTGSYLLAAIIPGPGLWIKDVSLGTFSISGVRIHASLPLAMLAALLFNAGLSVDTQQIRRLLQQPIALITGLAANLIVPVGFVFVVALTMASWHDKDAMQIILVGLAFIVSMPVAGSSAAWSQNTDGSLALSLGLVLFSTLLSPLTTPLVLHAVSKITSGDYARDLDQLASQGVGSILWIWVVLPSILGILVRATLVGKNMAGLKPHLEAANNINLLLLNYSNAAAALPQCFNVSNLYFFPAILAVTATLCVLTFSTGALLAKTLRLNHEQRTSMIFGLGMNNNGTGLVLASTLLSHHPLVLLPIILYNLIQHLVAGLVNRLLLRNAGGEHERSPGICRQAAADRLPAEVEASAK